MSRPGAAALRGGEPSQAALSPGGSTGARLSRGEARHTRATERRGLRRLRLWAAWLVAWGLLSSQSAVALDPSRVMTQYTLDTWGSDQRLPQNSVIAVAQAKDG